MLAIVVCALNEEGYLPTLLDSLAKQHRRPDQVVVVDDGSTDATVSIAERFGAREPWVKLVKRPPRPPERDRLARASVVEAFHFGVSHVDVDWSVVVKMDADLELPAEHCGFLMDRFADDPRLGMAGAYLSVRLDGRIVREQHPPDHVRGPNKFYRRECFEDIAPIPAILGWDAIDEVKARQHGWKTVSFALPGGDPIHLRPTGSYDGSLRGYRRAGTAAFAYGAHPLAVLGGAAVRARKPPRVLSGVAYLQGWLTAAARRHPRAEGETRAYLRREQLLRIRRRLVSGGRDAG